MNASHRVQVLFFVGLMALIARVHSFEFVMDAQSEKCFSELLSPNTLMIGEYKVSPGSNQEVSVIVLSPEKSPIFQDGNIKKSGHFQVVTNAVGGEYQICFENKLSKGYSYSSGLSRRVSFKIKSGVDAVDYNKIATKEHLKPVEVELLRMYDIINEIRDELKYQREREAQMRNTNESTNARVAWLSIFSLVVLIAVGAWQSFYVHSFLEKRKII